MTSERIKEIQQSTSYPNSTSVYQALMQVWNECAQSSNTTPHLSAEDRLAEEISQMSDDDFNKGIDELTKFIKTKLPQPTPTPEISAEEMLKHVVGQYANKRFAIVHLIHELHRVSIMLEKIGADATYYKNALEYLKTK